jgi:NAD(P)-dependent dehydrogenase (short-subunit alcohol dehydrogenase family)
VRGTIIYIESIGAFRGHPGLAAYTASKHGMNGLAKCLAVELGQHNIRVIGLAPTGILTPGVQARQAGTSNEDLERFQAMEKKILETVPLGRFGVPDDVARAALFAASDMAMLITGSTVAVDAGGMAH